MGGKKRNEVSKMQGQIGTGKVNSFSDRISGWNFWRIPQSSVLVLAGKRSSEFFKHSFQLVKKQMTTEFYKNSNIHGEFCSHLFSASRDKLSSEFFKNSILLVQKQMITDFYKNSNIHGEFFSHLFSASRNEIHIIRIL